MSALHELATAAGLATHWIDWQGVHREVSAATLQAVLGALGYQAGDPEACAVELQRLAAIEAEARLPPMLVVRIGEAVEVGRIAGEAERLYTLIFESGDIVQGSATVADDGRCRIGPFEEPGYHALHLNGQQRQLAVVPARAAAAGR